MHKYSHIYQGLFLVLWVTKNRWHFNNWVSNTMCERDREGEKHTTTHHQLYQLQPNRPIIAISVERRTCETKEDNSNSKGNSNKRNDISKWMTTNWKKGNRKKAFKTYIYNLWLWQFLWLEYVFFVLSFFHYFFLRPWCSFFLVLHNVAFVMALVCCCLDFNFI